MCICAVYISVSESAYLEIPKSATNPANTVQRSAQPIYKLQSSQLDYPPAVDPALFCIAHNVLRINISNEKHDLPSCHIRRDIPKTCLRTSTLALPHFTMRRNSRHPCHCLVRSSLPSQTTRRRNYAESLILPSPEVPSDTMIRRGDGIRLISRVAQLFTEETRFHSCADVPLCPD